MRKLALILVSVLISISILTFLFEKIHAGGTAKGRLVPRREWPKEKPDDLDPGIQALQMSPTAVDTYLIVHYDFEDMNWQGWTAVDNTRKVERCFFHVDNFSGMPGWSALEGTKSMWCGTRIDEGDPYTCSWSSAGYGNNWCQSFTSNAFYTDGGHFTLSLHGLFDIEPDYDWISIEWDRGDAY